MAYFVESSARELWVGCIAGALQDWEYVAELAQAGFDGIDIEPTRNNLAIIVLDVCNLMGCG